MTQQPGLDDRVFLESLKAAASEVDVGGKTLQDALCIMLVAWTRDVRLKEKLSELEEPTLPEFSTIIVAHLQAKATIGNTGGVNKVLSPGGNRNNTGQNKQGGQGVQGQQHLGISDAEKKLQTVMKGKCYQCGSGDHMANNCQFAKDIKCRICNASGHIAAACLPTASVRAVEGEGGQGQSTLALKYQPDKQQQQQPKQAAQINYVQTFPALQSSYPNREARADLDDMHIDTARTCLVTAENKKSKFSAILDSMDADYIILKNDILNQTCENHYANQLKAEFDNLSVDSELVYLDAKKIVMPKKE